MTYKIMIHGVFLPVVAMLLMAGKPEQQAENENVEASIPQEELPTPEQIGANAETLPDDQAEMQVDPESSTQSPASNVTEGQAQAELENAVVAMKPDSVTIESSVSTMENLDPELVKIEARVGRSSRVNIAVSVRSGGISIPLSQSDMSVLDCRTAIPSGSLPAWTTEMRPHSLPLKFERAQVEEQMDRIFKAVDSAVAKPGSTSAYQVLSLSCNKQGTDLLVSMVYVDPNTGQPVQFIVKGSRKQVEAKIDQLPTSLQRYLAKCLK